MQEKLDIMGDIWKILVDWLRRQASQVILLSCGIYAMWTIGTTQLQKQDAKIIDQEKRIEQFIIELRKCDLENASLRVEVNNLRFQIEVLIPQLRLRQK